MTRINKLVLHGFKSFAKRTELVFGKDFNCVLGPNGSGKSNILDALCFVLGKSSAKALRSEKASHLIYNGGKSKKPSNSGEVSIYFDNTNKVFPTDDKEVKVSRIVRASGQSIYKINDEARTRQQIIELLSLARIDPDGYNIILQGDIMRFVEMTPEERRMLVEEISGISIYEDKKVKAVAELDRVEQKMKEAEIVLAERKTHLNELKTDRDHAIKFKDVKDRIKTSKASLIYRQIEKRETERKELDARLEKQQKLIDEKKNEINTIKSGIKDMKARIDEINKEIEEKGEKEQVDMNKEIEKLRVDIASSKNRIDSVKNELSRIKQRKSQLRQGSDDLKAKMKNIEDEKADILRQIANRDREIKSIEKSIGEFRKKNKLDDVEKLNKDIDALDKLAEDKQKNIQDLRQQQQELLREKDRMELVIQGIDEKINKVMEVEKENKDQIEKLKRMREEFKKATAELNKRLSDDSEIAAQLGNARAMLLKYQEDISKLETKSMSIQERLGSESAITKILNQKDRIKGIYGTISELGKVGSKYSLALEVAAGPKITSIVVQDDKTAADCIKYLKTNKLGTATFLPLNKIKPQQIRPEVESLKSANGVEGMAIELISYDPKFKNAFSYVFGNTLVVENIDVARRIGIGSAKMATLDGDLAEVSGAMQGGFRKRGGSGLGFSEKEIEKDIKECQKRLDDTTALVSRLDKDQRGNQEHIEKLRHFKANIEGDIIKLEKSLNLDSEDMNASKKQRADLKKSLDDSEKRIDKVLEKISGCNTELGQNKARRQEIRSRITELSNPALLAEMNAFEEKKNQLKEESMSLNGEAKNLEAQAVNVLSPELENMKKIDAQHDKEENDFKKEIELLTEEITNMGADLKEKEDKQRKFQTKFKGLFTEKSKIDERIKKDEEKAEDMSERLRDVEQRINEINIDNAKLKAELAGFQEEFKEYEGVQVLKSKSEQDLRKEIGTCEGVLTKMGSVNMRALEIYDQVEKEYRELMQKKEKLVLEKEDVLIMINEVELKKKDLFMNSFNVVNQNFKNIFSALSTKGDASLVLENEEIPFEGGLFVKVRIAGTKFMDIRSLSGGEKSMTALAFIFAIQENEPASFYVLDEVDAALDKKNSEKLSQLVKKYAEKAQYILISHNDGVITEASTLYGVSMDENGISNVVSLRV